MRIRRVFWTVPVFMLLSAGHGEAATLSCPAANVPFYFNVLASAATLAVNIDNESLSPNDAPFSATINWRDASGGRAVNIVNPVTLLVSVAPNAALTYTCQDSGQFRAAVATTGNIPFDCGVLTDGTLLQNLLSQPVSGLATLQNDTSVAVTVEDVAGSHTTPVQVPSFATLSASVAFAPNDSIAITCPTGQPAFSDVFLSFDPTPSLP
jgi:hypothetical protein